MQNIPFSTASLTVSDDTAASDLTEALELALKPVLVDVPAEVSDEQVLDTLASILGLVLLHSGLALSLSLALLGRSLILADLLRRGLLGGFLVRVRVAGGIGVGGVGVSGSLMWC